ncbi:MAG: hypothetical protein AABZ12_13105 [Planctomycetota bacterium]
MLRKLGLTAVLAAAGGLPGCTAQHTVAWTNPHAHSENLTQSGSDHYHSALQTAEMDRRALIDDLDVLFMTERSTRLTRWHAR